MKSSVDFDLLIVFFFSHVFCLSQIAPNAAQKAFLSFHRSFHCVDLIFIWPLFPQLFE